MTQHPIILYDGECVLCSRSVQWLIRRDPAGRFRFASQSSEAGKALLAGHHLEAGQGVVFLEGGEVVTGGAAMGRILGQLGQPYRCVGWLVGVTPRFLREGVYRWVAANRRRLGAASHAECVLASGEMRSRFL